MKMYCVHYHNCNVMEKHCCSCNNHDIVCCSLKSDVGVQTDFSDKQTNNYRNMDPNILIDLFRKYYSGCYYNGEQSIAEAEAILRELRRVRAITCEQYNKFLGNCFVK